MPELPEVEVRKRYLQATSLGRTITKAVVSDARILDGETTPRSLQAGLKGTTFEEASRRGKYLLVLTGRRETLLMHFGMGGDLYFVEKGAERPAYTRVEFMFTGGPSLCYTNLRLFGKVGLYGTSDPDEIPDTAKLGPEPLERSFTFKRFKEALGDRPVTIHLALMEQERIAGIGNEYSDEITFQAGVRPDRAVTSLTQDEKRRLYDKMKWTLRRAIALGADFTGHEGEFLIPNRGAGGTCPGSDTRLVKKTIAGRTSYYCPDAQR